MTPTIEELNAALADLISYEQQTQHVDSAWFMARNQNTIRDTLTQAIAIARGESVVVPREPTDWMIAVGAEQIAFGNDYTDAYDAMINAAQEGVE